VAIETEVCFTPVQHILVRVRPIYLEKGIDSTAKELLLSLARNRLVKGGRDKSTSEPLKWGG
jgi:hypothetical protein